MTAKPKFVTILAFFLLFTVLTAQVANRSTSNNEFIRADETFQASVVSAAGFGVPRAAESLETTGWVAGTAPLRAKEQPGAAAQTPQNTITHAAQTSDRRESDFRLARVQYRGGGDWYNDPSSLTNLIRYVNRHLPVRIDLRYDDVAIGSRDVHRYPFLFLTGHGNITINSAEAANMRTYLDNGGFLYIDDDYGLDPFIRPVLKQIFPEEELIELPFSHPVYHQAWSFPQGLPKIHEHDGKPPQGFGIFRNGRLAVFYTYESNLADGWADADVHNVPPDLREESLRMGANLLMYVLTHSRYPN